MTELFLELAGRSLSAGWVVLAVAVLRLVLKKAPKAMTCALWALVAVRLLCPVSLESPLSLMPRTERNAAAGPVADVGEVLPGGLEQASPAETPQPAGPGQPHSVPASGAHSQKGKTAPDLLGWLWALGVAGMAGYACFSYLRLRRKVGASLDLGDGVLLCDEIGTPFILGLVKPKIYLPSALEAGDAAYALAHERSHLKRRDHWWKPLGFFLLAVYWFQPLLWLAYWLLCRDIELACDERVVKNMAPPEKKAYSEALLNCSVPRNLIAACPLAFGEVGVKQRIKSVLNYRKPGFWLILAGAAAVITAAVCLLTDPQHTLTEFLEISRSETVSIQLQGNKGFASMNSDAEMKAVWDILEQTQYDSVPVAKKDDLEFSSEKKIGQYVIELTDGEKQEKLCFARDCGAVRYSNQLWEAGNPQGMTDCYSVKDPKPLLAFFDKYVDPVSRREVTADPFATAEEPAKWMKNVTLGAIEEAWFTVYSAEADANTSITGVPRVEELLKILNTLPESALTDAGVMPAGEMTNVLSEKPSLCVSLKDSANGFGVMLRYFEDPEVHLQIAMCPKFEQFRRQETYSAEAHLWEIQDETLLAYMKEFAEHPSRISTFGGWWLDWEDTPMQVYHGFARIRVDRIRDWEYEAVEYREGMDSFGIRCRPGDAEEGWLYFSFWPEGYNPVEEDRYYSEGSSDGYRSVTSWPASYETASWQEREDSVFSYQKKEYPAGDYAIINEGADQWMAEKADDVEAQIINSLFVYADAMEKDGIFGYDGVRLDLTMVGWEYGFFEWDKIADDLGATSEINLTLLDARDQGNMRFVAGQYEEGSVIFLFRKKETYGYDYVGFQKPEKILTLQGEPCGIQTSYQSEDLDLTLCLVDISKVNAIQCHSGVDDYIRVDPADNLVVLDNTQWGGEAAFDLRGDEPPMLSYSLAPHDNALQFHAPEDDPRNSVYVYEGRVTGLDGVRSLHGYPLEPEKLEEIVNLLLALNQNGESCEEPEGIGKRQLRLLVDDGREGVLGPAELVLDYDGEAVTVTTCKRVKLYADKTRIKQASFRFQDETLNAFMESLIDLPREPLNKSSAGS